MGLALGAMPRSRRWVYDLLTSARAQLYGAPARPTHDDVLETLKALRQEGWVVSSYAYSTEVWTIRREALAVVYPALLEQQPLHELRQHLAAVDDYATPLGTSPRNLRRFGSMEVGAAAARLEAFSGTPRAQVEALVERLPYGHQDLETLINRALMDVIDADLLPMLSVDLQNPVLISLVMSQLATLAPAPFDLEPALTEYLAAETGPDSWGLRMLWAQWLLVMGQPEALDAHLPCWPSAEQAAQAGADKAVLTGRHSVEMLLACRHVIQGRWQEAERCFEHALALDKRISSARRGALGGMWGNTYYLMMLLQRPEPERLSRALKFALTECGRREPDSDTPEGLFAQAILMRQGERALQLRVFKPLSAPGQVRVMDVWRWLAWAWLKTGDAPTPLGAAELDAVTVLRGRLEAVGARTLLVWLDAALAVLLARPLEERPFFIGQTQADWQTTLDALLAVVDPSGKGAANATSAETRLLWTLQTEADGSVAALTPYEQKRGPRGWGKGKEVPLSRLHRSVEPLATPDVRVCAAIRQEGSSRTFRMDVAEALPALVGHPSVALRPNTEQLVEIAEATPELDVTRLPGPSGEADELCVRMLPFISPAGGTAQQDSWAASAAHQRELDALKCIRLLPDGPQRAKLYRLNPAQRRVALLLGEKGLKLPAASGAKQLQQVLAGLGAHFQIHSDATPVQAARELPADARLRAELHPEGDGLALRLVAAPFGPELPGGPRLVPGQGRARLVAALGGETLGVRRALEAETSHLETVLDACPMLAPVPPGAPCEWLLDSPDEALALLERLPTLNALQGVDWPKGQPVRVDSAQLGGLKLSLKSGQDWLGVDGELEVDEQLVLSLQQLLQLAAARRSRFVPLGEGRYLALTQELRERLDDLAAVAEPSGKAAQDLGALRVPTVAAPWLQQLADGAQTTQDAAFSQQLGRLDTARSLLPALPSNLQAALRPYQEEGFEWAMRLAHAGLGACLADDMGLGKTLQALAVLLARAGQGPALVVAPTSLLGNWRAEARKFAPSLAVRIYADAGAARTEQLATLGAGSLLLVSYPMVQIDQEAFAAKRWATLVLDEAQAIKNAAAKRSQAVFELQADFRLALSGTPIENRLAELWSIMRACNPGLLGSIQRFNERFAGPIERQRDRTAQRQLRRLIAPFILRRTKSQVLQDLPPRTELIYKVQPDAGEQAHYEALRRDTLEAAERSLQADAPGQAHLNILAGLTRLRRAACDPRLVNPQFGTVGAKVMAFGELAAELVANGHKALVFSQFVDFLALLKQPLDAAGIAYQYLDGSTPTHERTRRVDAFQAGQGELFLISLKAGGFGLNLTVADYVVIADPWWNPAAEDQASGRAHRMGQQRPVTVYRLVNQGTLEDKIIALHQQKRELADLLLEGAEAAAVPAADELLALMRGEGAPSDAED